MTVALDDQVEHNKSNQPDLDKDLMTSFRTVHSRLAPVGHKAA